MTFEIYGKPECNIVSRLMSFLERKKLPYKFRSVSVEENVVFLYESNAGDELPVVFKEDKLIGNFDAVLEYASKVINMQEWKRKNK